MSVILNIYKLEKEWFKRSASLSFFEVLIKKMKKQDIHKFFETSLALIFWMAGEIRLNKWTGTLLYAL